MVTHSAIHWRQIIALILLPIFTLSLFLSDLALAIAKQDNEEIFVGPGDAIRIIVVDGNRTSENENPILTRFNREFVLDGRGYIRLSVLGEVYISGLDAEEIADILKEKFRIYVNDPIVDVIPLIRVTLYGAFRSPGTYRVGPDITFWDLVDRAGGPTAGINYEKIRVERNGEMVEENLLTAYERAYSLREIGIQSGDHIIAPTKRQLSFTDIVTISNFGISLIMMYLTIQNYRSWRRYE